MQMSVKMLVGGFAAASLVGCVAMDEGTETPIDEQEFALGTGLLPDIVQQVPNHLGINNQQGHEYLRFTTSLANVGVGKLQILGLGQVEPCTIEGEFHEQCTHATQQVLDADGNVVQTKDAGFSFFHEEHSHWHQSDVALFEIRQGSLTGPVVGQSFKITFCLIDYEWLDGTDKKTRTYFLCNGQFQGITPGWADQYHHSTEGQNIEMTGQPEGIYYLIIGANPSGNWLESNYANNTTWVKFRFYRDPTDPKVSTKIEELENSGCDPALGTYCTGNSKTNR